MFDHLYLYALLIDAPDQIKKSLLAEVEVDKKWEDICQDAERLAFGKVAKHSSGDQLHSIFAAIATDERSNWTENSVYSALPISISQDCFPGKGGADDQEKLWLGLLQEYKLLKAEATYRIKSEYVLQLLFKYTSRIACAREGYEFVSFYDLARLRAGLAVALMKSDEETKGQVLLIGGDVSGIQRFLYDIVSKNASRNLKGRSFYLYLLVNNIIDNLISRLGLYQANIAFDSGGSFLLIAPNNDVIKEELNNFEQHLNNSLFEQHRTSIGCYFGCHPLGDGAALVDAFTHISEEQIAKKTKPFFNKVQNYDQLFDPQFVEKGGVQARDVVTGEELSAREISKSWYFDPVDEEDLFQATEGHQQAKENLISDASAMQIILGQRLKQFDYWIKSTEPIPELSTLYIQNDVHLEILNLGVYNYLLTKKDFELHEQALSSHHLKISAINSFSWPINHVPASWERGFHLYGGNQGPKVELAYLRRPDKCVPKTFSEMAGSVEADRVELAHQDYANSELGFKRLGVLRMDVDNLGRIFRSGVPKTKYCLASYCNLSRSMDFFFKGYLNQLWEEKDRHKYTQIIYAGGDDLFIVGRWDKVFEFALDIKEAFSAWTLNNKHISISGGMVIVTHKYPVMKAAAKAGSAEKKSKNYNYTTSEKERISKNAFTVFDYPLRWSAIASEKKWSNEFDLLLIIADQLTEHIRQPGGRKGLPVSLLRNIYDLKEIQDRAGGPNSFSWQWKAAYAFSQLESRLKKEKSYEGEKLLKQIKEGVLFDHFAGKKFRNDGDMLSLLTMAARLTELRRRTQSTSLAEMPSC